jgi:hypothetical protein
MVNLTINAAMQTVNTAQRSVARSASIVSGPPPAIDSVIKAGQYISSKGVIDSAAGIYVVQFRDSETGAVKMQYPAKQAANVYKKTASTVESNAGAPATVAPAPVAPAPAATQTFGIEQSNPGTPVSGGSQAKA